MAIIENEKDKLLQAATIRLLYTAENYIYFSTAAPVFNVNAQNVASPTSYTINAILAGSLKGTVTWSVVSGTIQPRCHARGSRARSPSRRAWPMG
jgi:hypothetical protein